jgi:hypothetical protein
LSQLEPKLFFSIFLKQILELKHGFRSVMRTEPQRSNAFPVKCEHDQTCCALFSEAPAEEPATPLAPALPHVPMALLQRALESAARGPSESKLFTVGMGSEWEPPGTGCCPARFSRGNAKLWKWNSWGQGRLCETILEQPCATEPDDQRCVLCVLSVTRGGLQPSNFSTGIALRTL